MKFRLNDLAEVGSSKRIYAKEYKSSGIPFYRGKEIIAKSEGRKIDNSLFISKDRYNTLLKKCGVPKENDILISAVGTIGKVYHVAKSDIPFYFKDGNLIRIYNYNYSLIDPYYLYYLLKSYCGQNAIRKIEIGSTQKAITINELSSIVLDIPSLQKQQEISNKLKKIDALISVNSEINDNLDDLLTLIFEKFAINMKFEKSNLVGIANFKNGLPMQKFQCEKFENGIPVLKIRELSQGYTDSSSDRCSMKINKDYIVKTGDIVFSWSGTLMVKIWSGTTSGLNQHLFKVTSKKFPSWFIYEWTKHYLKKFKLIAAGKATTMGHIKRSDLMDSIVFIPNYKFLSQLTRIMKPIYDERIKIIKQNQHLNCLKKEFLTKYF